MQTLENIFFSVPFYLDKLRHLINLIRIIMVTLYYLHCWQQGHQSNYHWGPQLERLSVQHYTWRLLKTFSGCASLCLSQGYTLYLDHQAGPRDVSRKTLYYMEYHYRTWGMISVCLCLITDIHATQRAQILALSG